MKKEFVYHIISELDWIAIQDHQTYEPNSLKSDGFIHFSYKDQVCDTAARFYTGRTDLLVLKVDRKLLDSNLQDDPVPGGGVFPHLYGPLNLTAVVSVLRLSLNSDLSFSLIDGA